MRCGRLFEPRAPLQRPVPQGRGFRSMNTDTQRQFVKDMQNLGLQVCTYNGRYFYHGFGVVTDDPDEVVRETTCVLQQDTMGRRVIIYPSAGITEEEMNELAKEFGINEDNWGQDETDLFSATMALIRIFESRGKVVPPERIEGIVHHQAKLIGLILGTDAEESVIEAACAAANQTPG